MKVTSVTHVVEVDKYLDYVREFHRALYKTDEATLNLGANTALCRLRLMAEELGELASAMHEGDRVKIADGLADLLYVTFGTALVYGVPIADVFAEVHASNMTKDFPPEGGGTDRKATKGANYRPPDIAAILGVHRY